MKAFQARAARAMLNLSVREVGQLANVQPNTVSRIEQDNFGSRGPLAMTIEALRRVYEERGVVFFDDGETPPQGPGVWLKDQQG
ncbi:helix-turn-helix transcriptional regulator [Rhizobium sp. TH2]|uniref:helix-turn-helix domain-containing protein n=1 Tax=Rhizobium sp. TH2 TaxID=2775403 RepID=UPI0021588A42|nr:helix-turn-helix transcriptional regulator [Rhizobium sp. TH2]UVC10505.1 helix-turn-helix transcriptional regulator [Rhizobium sp. TH2]